MVWVIEEKFNSKWLHDHITIKNTLFKASNGHLIIQFNSILFLYIAINNFLTHSSNQTICQNLTIAFNAWISSNSLGNWFFKFSFRFPLLSLFYALELDYLPFLSYVLVSHSFCFINVIISNLKILLLVFASNNWTKSILWDNISSTTISWEILNTLLLFPGCKNLA